MKISQVYILLVLLISVALAVPSQAQLCSGSLGDPIVNITFGAGPNPGPALSAANTNYNFLGTDCPTDGQYAIRSNTTNCFASTWHSLTADHTGDTNGYLMLVNASQVPGAFYLDTVRGLCANTTYEFAAWVVNVLKPTSCNGNGTLPNLTFRIERTDGTLVQDISTGNITATSAPQWRQFGFFFRTPANVTDVVLRIINNAPGGCGNDLGLDDITFRPCGPALVPSIVNGTGEQLQLCEGDTSTVSLSCSVSAGFTSPVFQWQQSLDNGATWQDVPGETATTLRRNFATASPSTFWYRLTATENGNINNASCRVSSRPLKVTVNARPIVTVSNNSPVCAGATGTLSVNGASAVWNGPAGFTANGLTVSLSNISAANAGKYYVEVSNAAGCKTKDSTVININPSPTASVLFSDTSICDGRAITLNATGGSSYSWTPAVGLSAPNIPNPEARPLASTRYTVRVSNALTCTDSANVWVRVQATPVANAGPDRFTREGQPVQLLGSASGDSLSYVWTPAYAINDRNMLQPTVQPLVDTFYILNVSSALGCGTDVDTVLVRVFKQIRIPNAFTPNGDGVNDKWQIPALAAYKSYELMVYNRYGQLLLQTNNFTSWDGNSNGKPLPVGTYYYVISVKDLPEVFSGTITIIR